MKAPLSRGATAVLSLSIATATILAIDSYKKSQKDEPVAISTDTVNTAAAEDQQRWTLEQKGEAIIVKLGK